MTTLPLLRWLAALGLIVAMGWLRMGPEDQTTLRQRELRLRAPASALPLAEQLNQDLFGAVLGGFRGVTASWLSIQTMVNFYQKDWDGLNQKFRLITRLQPQVQDYWEAWSHHMAYNANGQIQERKDLPVLLKRKMSLERIGQGADILREGMKNLPDSWWLPMRLGDLYNGRTGKNPDPRQAAMYYEMAWNQWLRVGQAGQKEFLVRNAAYQWAMCSDEPSWRKAWVVLADQWKKGNRFPSVARDLKVLQERLDLPLPERIALPDQRKPAEWEKFLNNPRAGQ